MTHTQSHEESLQTALQALRDRMGDRWDGREDAGRAHMVRVLQQTLGYNSHQANTVIEALIHMDRLRYHHYARGEEQASPGQAVPAFMGPGAAGSGVASAALPVGGGYWMIGPEFE